MSESDSEIDLNYVDEFTIETANDWIVVGNYDKKKLQKREKKLEKERVTQVKKIVSGYKKQHQRLPRRVKRTLSTIKETEAQKRKHHRSAFRKQQKADRKRYHGLSVAFNRAKFQLSIALALRKREVQATYGRLVTSDVRKYNTFDWRYARLPLNIDMIAIRAPKDRLPPGIYHMKVSKISRVGGGKERWNMTPFGPKSNMTEPFMYNGRRDTLVCDIGRTLTTVCPSRFLLNATMCLQFELVLKAGLFADKGTTVAWAVFPLVNSNLNVVKGNFKVAMIKGRPHRGVSLHRDFTQVYTDSLDEWVGNLFFSLRHEPRLHKGRGEFETELMSTGSILGIEFSGLEDRIAEYRRLQAQEQARPRWAKARDSLLRYLPFELMPEIARIGESAAEDPADTDVHEAKVEAVRDIQRQLELEIPSAADTPSLPAVRGGTYGHAAYPYHSDDSTQGSPRDPAPTPGVYKCKDDGLRVRVYPDTAAPTDSLAMQPSTLDRTRAMSTRSLTSQKMNRSLKLISPSARVLPGMEDDVMDGAGKAIDLLKFTDEVPLEETVKGKEESGSKAHLALRMIAHDLGFLAPLSVVAFLSIVFAVFSVVLSMNVHYLTQYGFLKLMGVAVGEFTYNYLYYTITYEAENASLYTEVGMTIVGPIACWAVALTAIAIVWAISHLVRPSFVAPGWRLALWMLVICDLDPVTILVSDLIRGRTNSGDLFKLFTFFDNQEGGNRDILGNGMWGIILTVCFLVGALFMSVISIYIYILDFHQGGLLADTFQRLMNLTPMSTPHDMEISVRELQWVLEKTERYRGPNGERRKVMVDRYVNTHEDGKEDDTIAVSIFTLSRTGGRTLHRQFLRLPDGALVEALGDATLCGAAEYTQMLQLARADNMSSGGGGDGVKSMLQQLGVVF
ncbi:hypothetical protein J8273_7309 [Carpediemonas membranifera]|uniref:Uncharacterized protein n=1 Tax=Carpediemonas membranifera TaxID=201153 RepID=A0A8J6ATF2_9EUKA|nr:hypothetical protein J8273_7309 [Carpediemonas membranifera]|eukprot:KAG9391035.1 hypothetical protein J8273_7309 [Carpediemonas membranifera]